MPQSKIWHIWNGLWVKNDWYFNLLQYQHLSLWLRNRAWVFRVKIWLRYITFILEVYEYNTDKSNILNKLTYDTRRNQAKRIIEQNRKAHDNEWQNKQNMTYTIVNVQRIELTYPHYVVVFGYFKLWILNQSLSLYLQRLYRLIRRVTLSVLWYVKRRCGLCRARYWKELYHSVYGTVETDGLRHLLNNTT